MGMIESAILSICMSSSNVNSTACTSAITAGAKQTGFEQVTNDYENHQLKLYEKDAYYYLGKDNAETIGGAAWLTNAAITRKASVGLPTLGLCDKLSTEIQPDQAKIVFKWVW